MSKRVVTARPTDLSAEEARVLTDRIREGFRDLAVAGTRTRRTPRRESGLVYFIQQGTDGPVKIGVAANPLQRLRELQVGNATPLMLVGIRPGGFVEEARLHRLFAHQRVSGEWFHPTAEMMRLALVPPPVLDPPIGRVRSIKRDPETARQMDGRRGGLKSWANTVDRTARTTNGRKAGPGSIDYHLARLDPDRFAGATDQERLQAAKAALRLHFMEMASRSAKTRARRKGPPS